MPRLVFVAPSQLDPFRRPPVSQDLAELKLRIDRGAYVVDPRLVAEFVLRRNGLRLLQAGLRKGR